MAGGGGVRARAPRVLRAGVRARAGHPRCSSRPSAERLCVYRRRRGRPRPGSSRARGRPGQSEAGGVVSVFSSFFSYWAEHRINGSGRGRTRLGGTTPTWNRHTPGWSARSRSGRAYRRTLGGCSHAVAGAEVSFGPAPPVSVCQRCQRRAAVQPQQKGVGENGQVGAGGERTTRRGGVGTAAGWAGGRRVWRSRPAGGGVPPLLPLRMIVAG